MPGSPTSSNTFLPSPLHFPDHPAINRPPGYPHSPLGIDIDRCGVASSTRKMRDSSMTFIFLEQKTFSMK
ncbi:hypothetical protein E2C01_098639 [Portunus trituberculatus]|uniref:Uncharacterized protein n=1 Tax=Portunus trituberculatus TaxID=210409 RepID=A0A5B7K8S0_PORTR|nr:hypothetical protein [Portunus trituberculatus]